MNQAGLFLPVPVFSRKRAKTGKLKMPISQPKSAQIKTALKFNLHRNTTVLERLLDFGWSGTILDMP